MQKLDFADTKFHGAGFDPAQDKPRLVGQLARIYDFITQNGRGWTSNIPAWFSLREASEACGVPEASVSAYLRTLRNQHGFIIDRKRSKEGSGQWLYLFRGPGHEKKSRKRRNSAIENPPQSPRIGNPILWEEYQRALYACADAPSAASLYDLAEASEKWAAAFIRMIQEERKGQ